MQILDKTFTGGSSHPKQIKNNHRLLALILLDIVTWSGKENRIWNNQTL